MDFLSPILWLLSLDSTDTDPLFLRNVVGEKADGSVLQVWGFFLNDNGLWTIRSGNGKYLSTQDNLSTNGTVLVLTDEETVQWKVKNDSGTAGSIK